MTVDTEMSGEEAQRDGAHRLQWQMLAGFVGGLLLGLLVYALAPGADWVEAISTRPVSGR